MYTIGSTTGYEVAIPGRSALDVATSLKPYVMREVNGGLLPLQQGLALSAVLPVVALDNPDPEAEGPHLIVVMQTPFVKSVVTYSVVDLDGTTFVHLIVETQLDSRANRVYTAVRGLADAFTSHQVQAAWAEGLQRQIDRGKDQTAVLL